ncbi:MAG: hypothetical protein LWW85_10085 [Marinilabiliales bacterium]|nr:hypothetical protein [Marinilabiliales bacterium]
MKKSNMIPWIKKSCLLLAATWLALAGFAQHNKVEIFHYILPEFTDGTVLLKSGVKQRTQLNYNALTEEMIFDQNGKKLAIGPVDQVDTVYINDRKFIPFNKKFLEILYQNKYQLLSEHRCSVIDPGKPAAYGGTTQTGSVTSYTSYFSGGQVYELTLPEGIQTKGFTIYWAKVDGKPEPFFNLRQLTRMFKGKEEAIKKYIKENKVDYEKEESLIPLFHFLEQL